MMKRGVWLTGSVTDELATAPRHESGEEWSFTAEHAEFAEIR